MARADRRGAGSPITRSDGHATRAVGAALCRSWADWKSAALWNKAGRRSATRSAMAETAAQFQKGLDQLALVPDTPERKQLELELRSGLGTALMIVKGYAAPETGRNYARARELWEQLGSAAEFLNVPWGQFFFHVNRCEFDLAQHLAKDLLRVSGQHNDTAGLVLGHTCCGRTLLPISRFGIGPSASRTGACSRCTDLPGILRENRIPIDPAVTSQTNLATVLFCVGVSRTKTSTSNRAAIAGARRLVHRPSLLRAEASVPSSSACRWSRPALLERLDQLDAWWGSTVSRSITRRNRSFAAGSRHKWWCGGGAGPSRSGSTAYRAIGQGAWMPFISA